MRRRLPVADYYPFGNPARSLEDRVRDAMVRSTIESIHFLLILSVPLAIGFLCLARG